jgi:alkylation response protein AidB-like acyl-CoA dehydrogenase
MDTDTLDLLRTTAGGVFGGSPSRAAMGDLGWLGLLTPPEHGGSGWGAHIDSGAILGELGGGWNVAMAGLESERFGVGGNVLLLDLLIQDVATVASNVSIGEN